MVTYPRPLVAGDVVGVTSPSTGLQPAQHARLDVALAHLHRLGWRTRVGGVMGGDRVSSGPPRTRAAELTAMLTDPEVRAVVPPWGGHVAIDLLHLLDWDRLAEDPTWFVGSSDISTLLLPLTLRTGVATLHGQNLLDTPYRVPEPLLPWTDVVAAPAGATIVQGAATAWRCGPFVDYEAEPGVTEYVLDAPGGWTRVDAGADDAGEVDVTGRLVGGCLETVAHLAGTPYGDVADFAARHAPEGLVVHLENAGSDAADVTRRLFGLRYAGWFDHATAVLLGRTQGTEVPELTHHDAARRALGDLGIPVLVDVDCGHVPPHLALVNGALARVVHGPGASRLEQRLV